LGDGGVPTGGGLTRPFAATWTGGVAGFDPASTGLAAGVAPWVVASPLACGVAGAGGGGTGAADVGGVDGGVDGCGDGFAAPSVARVVVAGGLFDAISVEPDDPRPLK
jgi:hypothetical protein